MVGNVSGLTINAANCIVRGLVINSFQHDTYAKSYVDSNSYSYADSYSYTER